MSSSTFPLPHPFAAATASTYTVDSLIEQLNDYIVLNDVTDDDKQMSALKQCLSGCSANLLDRYIKQHNGRVTYQQAVNILRKRYANVTPSKDSVHSLDSNASQHTSNSSNDSPAPAHAVLNGAGGGSIKQARHDGKAHGTNGYAQKDGSNNIQWLDLNDKLTIRDIFRNAAASVWVICSADQRQPVGFTAISLISVSIEPPIVSFNINKTSSSLTTVLQSMRYSAHLMGNTDEHITTAKLFASKPSENRFKQPDTYSWDNHSMPIVHNHIARLSGKITTLHDAGDSFVAVCNVEAMTLKQSSNIADVIKNNKSVQIQPLVYFDGLYQNVSLSNKAAAAAGSSSFAAKPKRQIHLNAFQMCCVGHQNPGQWANPDDNQWNYCDMDHWLELARILDDGGFDCLFLADVLGVYDVYEGNRDAAVKHACQIGVNDPLLHVTAMSAVTKHLGFGVTVSTTYELPYAFARKMSTLDHLTKGRVAWNVVTSYLESAAINLGLSTQISHDDRYDIAEEFLDVCYKLWEQSWEDDAVVKDRNRRVYTEPSKVHEIKHYGKNYQVPGVHLCEPSPQRTPVIFQAGASSRGQAFAGKHAEAVFVAAPTPEQLKKLTTGIRAATNAQGRDGDAVRIFTMLTIIVGETDEAAEAKLQEYMSYASADGALALMGGWTGVDLSSLQQHEPLKHMVTQANHSALASFTKDPSRVWTKQDVADHVSIGGRGGVLVGSPQTVCDELERFVDVGDVDGFNLCYMVSHDTFKDIVKYIVPELRRRGRMSAQPSTPVTLRERMQASSNSWVEDRHPAAAYRRVRQQYSADHNKTSEQTTPVKRGLTSGWFRR